MSKTVSTDSASAAELEISHAIDDVMETGFLPDDPHYRLTGEFKPETTEASAAFQKETQPGKDGASAAPDEKDQSENLSEKPDASAAPSSKAAASETASTQNEGKREGRWEKRERELKELRAKVARLEAKPQTEQQRSETQQTTQSAAAETKPAPKPKIDDVDANGKPKYKSYAE